MSTDFYKVGLDALYYTRAHTLFSPYSRGIGVILTLHHVKPACDDPFHPNRILEVTPEFLEEVIVEVRRAGYDIVSLDEAHRRIVEPGNDRPFVAFTFDDGYRDNRDYAYPILKKHHCPFTIYAASAYCDGTGELWWLGLEEAIRHASHLEVDVGGGAQHFELDGPCARDQAFKSIYWWLRSAGEDEQRAFVRELCARHDVDLAAMCRDYVMSWDELAELARDPLLTVGAHTIDHYALAKLDEDEARRQIERGADIVGERLGVRPVHFSFPYGDASSAGPREFDLAGKAGFVTAVTTRKGVIYGEHAEHLNALPRVSLNGEFQSWHYVDMFLTGAPFLLSNGFRRLNVA